MVDYTVPPPTWPLPVHPPVQKGTPGRVQRYLAPVLALSFFVGAVYVYFNQDEDIYEYWRQVEQGNVPMDDDDDDDEDYDDNDDEWEYDQQKPKV
jgi:hypothetical protein